jgi:HEAT repeat protein
MRPQYAFTVLLLSSCVSGPAWASDASDVRDWLEEQSVNRDCRELHKLPLVQRVWVDLLAEEKGKKVDRLRAIEVLGACDPTQTARERLTRILHGAQPPEFQQAAADALATGWPALATQELAVALNQSPEALVRAHVALTLGSLGYPESIGALRDRLSRESDRSVQDALRIALRNASR